MTDRDPFLDCVHCGLCLSFCPTYEELGTEMDSPRGRIYLMRAVAEGRLAWSGRAPEHLDLCLGCLACETACPSGIHYRHLLERARAEVRRTVPQSWAERVLLQAIFTHLFPHPRRLGIALAGYQRTGLQRWVRKRRLSRWLPPHWRAMEALLPSRPPKGSPLSTFIPAYEKGTREGASRGERIARVGLLTGCVQSVLFPDVNAATARVLSATGCEIVVPPKQVCCGALASHNGNLEAARKFARRNIDAFGAYDLDAVLVNAAGCGTAMKDYGTLLQGDPDYAEKAAEFSTRVRDVTEFLTALWIEHPPSLCPLSARVTYHDACHLAHGQGITAEPRQLLAAIPGLDLVELPESDWCCGSAGVYSIVQPEMSQRLLQRKVNHLMRTGADIVIACNPGCLLQIRQGLEQMGSAMEACHLVTLLDRVVGEGRRERGE